MAYDIGQIAAGTVATLAPFTPFLTELGRTAAKKLAEVIAEKGGEAAWKRAQALWSKIKGRFGDDPELTSSMTLVAIRPGDEARQTMLAETLGARLKASPDLAQELLDVLGGQQAAQQVLAGRDSWVEEVTQQIQGAGTQTIEAKDGGVIKGVRQIKH